MSSFNAPVRPPFGWWGVKVDRGVENVTNRNLVPTFLFDFYTHYFGAPTNWGVWGVRGEL